MSISKIAFLSGDRTVNLDMLQAKEECGGLISHNIDTLIRPPHRLTRIAHVRDFLVEHDFSCVCDLVKTYLCNYWPM